MFYIVVMVSLCHDMVQSLVGWLTLAYVTLSAVLIHSELLCLAWIKPHGLVDLEGCMVDNCKPHSCVESESVNTCHLSCEIVSVTICSGVFSRAAVFGLRNLQCEREGLVFIQEQIRWKLREV